MEQENAAISVLIESDSEMDEMVRETFESEMVSALNTVRFVASEKQPEFIDTISNLYAEQYGEHPSVEQLSALLHQIQAELADEAHSEAEADEFAAEFEAALQHTREVAVSHQEGLVNSICDIFAQINGKEPTVQDLSGIFGRVRDALAQEAEEQFVDIDENDKEYLEKSIKESENNLRELIMQKKGTN